MTLTRPLMTLTVPYLRPTKTQAYLLGNEMNDAGIHGIIYFYHQGRLDKLSITSLGMVDSQA